MLMTTRTRRSGVLGPDYRAMTIGVVALVSLIAFENLAVTTAMPTVADALDGLSWYALAFGGPLASGVVAMVLSGSWSDARGPVRPMWHGVGWFLTGLVLAGLAPQMWVLVLGRVVQGFGAGLVTVALYVVVGHLYPAALRPRIFALFAAGWVLPALVGPAIAGLVVEHADWRAVFLAVPVIAVPAALLMRPGLRALDQDVAANPTPIWTRRTNWAVGAAIGVGLLNYGGRQDGAVLVVLIGVGLAAIGAFAPRLLPAGTFALRRGLPALTALRGLVAAAGFGAEVFLPLMLTRERGLSPALAGLVLTSSALAWSAGSWYRGRPDQRFSHGVVLQAGMALIAVGIATAVATLSDGVPVIVGIVGWSVTGLGMGIVFPTLSVLVLELSPKAEQGTNSSAMQLSDSLLTATVLAVGGSLFAVIEPHSADVAYLTAFGVPGLLALLGIWTARRSGV